MRIDRGTLLVGAGFFLAPLIIIVLGLVAWRTTRRAAVDTEWVAHTLEVRATVDDARLGLASAENVRRGFELTGREAELEPFDRYVALLDSSLRRLDSLTRDNARQQTRVAELRTLVAERITHLREGIAVRRAGESGADLESRLADGSRLTAAIESRFAAMAAEEQALLAERQAQSTTRGERAERLNAIGSLAAVLMILLAGGAVLSERRHRARAEATAVERGAMLESVLNAIQDAVFAADAAGRIVLYNDAARQFVTAEEERAPLPDDWLHRRAVLRMDGTPLPAAEIPLVRATQGESVTGMLIRIPAGPGHPAIVTSNTARPIRDPEGRVQGGAVVVRDVTVEQEHATAIETLNAELQGAVDRLQAVNAELEAFTYSVSHDLRAPIRHVDGYLGLLRKHVGGGLDDKGQRYLDVISAASRQMGCLIDDLLALSRVSRVEMVPAGDLDLAGLVAEVVAQAEEQAGPDRRIEWNIGPLPRVTGDRALLRIALTNLVGNAVKYTRPADPARIRISAYPDREGRDVIVVQDNGIGFDMQYAHKLFGVFQRLHATGEFEGTGIGLATVQRVIHRHGGEVWAQAAPGEGATFSFALPRRNA